MREILRKLELLSEKLFKDLEKEGKMRRIKLEEKPERQMATRIAYHYIGKWYKWGGDDPSGFDCSRFTGELLKSVGLLPRGRPAPTAQGQWNHFYKFRVKRPYEGCLVFFGKDSNNVSHVEYCVSSKYAIGSSGGGSNTNNIQDAIKHNAFIKQRPIERNRNIVGFVDPFRLIE
ncbi:MAG: C40 family peptidase [Candidatus Aenigmatarchaeota archaeon]